MSNIITLRPQRNSQPSTLMALINDMERLLDARDPARTAPTLSARVIPFQGNTERPSIPQHELTRRAKHVLRLAADWGVGHLVVRAGQEGAARARFATPGATCCLAAAGPAIDVPAARQSAGFAGRGVCLSLPRYCKVIFSGDPNGTRRHGPASLDFDLRPLPCGSGGRQPKGMASSGSRRRAAKIGQNKR